VKGVGSISRAILRGGLRFRGGTVISEDAVGEVAKRFMVLDVVGEEEVLTVALEREEGAGANADEVEAASEAMTAAE
jgi:hypothetical protein